MPRPTKNTPKLPTDIKTQDFDRYVSVGFPISDIAQVILVSGSGEVIYLPTWQDNLPKLKAVIEAILEAANG